MIELVRGCLPPGRWTVERSGVWVRATRRAVTDPPVQGWKIHVSAYASSAEQVLRAALPVLVSGGANFKIVASRSELDRMNRGELGFTQVGKFLTVYPDDTATAVRIAHDLDGATRGLGGPRVPSDYPLRRDSVVHYRYGAFRLIPVQLAVGHVVPGLYSGGRLVPDDRRKHTADRMDPFEPERERTKLDAALASRYHIFARLQWTPRASVHAAVDLQQLRQCVIKCVERRSEGGPARLEHEASILRALAGSGICPQLYEVVTDGTGGALVMQDLGGRNMEDVLSRRMRLGRLCRDDEVRSIGRRLASLLEQLHGRGIVYRDLKPSNVVVSDEDERLRLIDFEFAHDVRDSDVPLPAGTRGFMCRHGAVEGRGPEPADDVYSLGAFLYYAATGANPCHAPDPDDLPQRPVRLLNPSISHGMQELIAHCLRADPRDRPSLAQVTQRLLGSGDAAAAAAADPEAGTGRAALRTARALADALCDDALPSDGHLTWFSAHPSAFGLPHRFVHTGAAGCILALAEAVREFRCPRHRDVLADSAGWLRSSVPFAGAVVPGLYVGEAGVGAALLRAGQVLPDPELVEQAARISDSLAAFETGSPDLMNGRAGVLRFHLLVHDETGDRRHLAHAEAAGRALLLSAESPTDSTVCWRIPHGYGELSGKAYCGYAHGAAGIADALIDLYRASGDDRFATAASAAGRWLMDRAHPALPDGGGREWPSSTEGSAGVWCHGAAGIGRFFLNLVRADLLHDDQWSRAAAAMVARGARWLGPAYCHGLAGSIDFLLDMYQHTREPEYRHHASIAMRLLDAFRIDDDGTTRWQGDTAGCVTPDYMVGYGGILVSTLRYAFPGSAPSQLTVDGFRLKVAVGYPVGRSTSAASRFGAITQ